MAQRWGAILESRSAAGAVNGGGVTYVIADSAKEAKAMVESTFAKPAYSDPERWFVDIVFEAGSTPSNNVDTEGC